ncbi:type I polyketide synthase [Lysobacter enzymogenes]|uniref:type I polyketide synthase n=1 Tax=Lysobacter enzymogenes TaxID=69 RepID=UPI001A962F77|nr:type I polyketide synthase [Lysobacter enzymogenes]QQP95867.1 acyltransferase domain-containing protein [Lysobacter enzymogenes]
METLTRSSTAAVAIVGIGCRFPGGGNDPETFWNNLRQGLDCIGEVPADRWHRDNYYHPRKGVRGKSATRWGGFVDGIDRFDAGFFGISPREAAAMDPQQRLLLEVCWEAFEDAAIVPSSLHERAVGVYMGGFTLDYMLQQLGNADYRNVEAHTATGSMMTLLAARLSYVFGLRGPCMSIDTACSSSMVAVHLACQSLRNGESDLALAGGVNALLGPAYTIAESQAGMLSPTGRSRAFDSRADGYVRGEGAGIVVLKRLDDALAAGDHIYATILATQSNQDGRSQGITVPSADAQRQLMRAALAAAGTAPAQIAYVEAHGTGTPVGDPIEASAIGSVMSEGRDASEPCLMGSIKTNIGHTEAAAGVAALIKAALVLERGQVPPHLHLLQPNPQIDLQALKLRVPTELTELPQRDGAALAAVNSFGFGGSNAHAILRSAPARSASATHAAAQAAPGPWLLPLSARHPESLLALAGRYADRLGAGGALAEAALQDVCRAAALGREHHPHRACVAAASTEQLAQRLRELADGGRGDGVWQSDVPVQAAPGLVFVYSGSGPQWWGMGQQLYRREPVFKAAVDRCAQLFARIAGWDLLPHMLADAETARANDTDVVQSAGFILQVGLTELLAQWGVRPAAIVGHSLGEIAAAYAAGCLSLEDAVCVIHHRSRLLHRMAGHGAMLAVGLTREQAQEAIDALGDATVSIAAINGPAQITVAGSLEGIERLQAELSARELFVRRLRVQVPFHSCYMDGLREEMLASTAAVAPRPAQVPLYSTVSGQRVETAIHDNAYWFANMREPVRFADAATAILADGGAHFVEISPHPVLASSLGECANAADRAVRITATLHRERDESERIAGAVAELYCAGVAPDWRERLPRGAHVRLPGYAWRKERHWHESAGSARARLEALPHPLLQRRIDLDLPTWEADLDSPQLEFLQDHQLDGTVVFPGAGYADMALSAARAVHGHDARLAVADIRFERALYLSQDQATTLRVGLDPRSGAVRIASRGEDERWRTHCSGRIEFDTDAVPAPVDLDAVRARCPRDIPAQECYAYFRSVGLQYGPTFRGLVGLQQGEGEAVARVEVPAPLRGQLDTFNLHPAVLDLCFQTLAAALPLQVEGSKVYMPTGFARGRSYGPFVSDLVIHAQVTRREDDRIHGDVYVYAPDGELLLAVAECTAKVLGGAGGFIETPQRLYAPAWQEAAPVEAAEAAPGAWLLRGDGALAAAVAAELRVRGHDCIELDAEADDVGSWTRALDAHGASVRGVIDLVPPAPAEPSRAQALELIAQRCLPAFDAVRALAQRVGADKPRLWIATQAAQRVLAGDRADPFAGAAWGLGRIVGHAEHIDFWGGAVDVEGADAATDARCLVDECLGQRREDQIAWRDGRRYTLQLRDSGVDAAPDALPALRADASYLVTGGLGALGLEIAAWMVERGARHLVLIGRTPPPPRAQWRALPADHAQAGLVARLLELERAGASVAVECFDIADAAALDSLLARMDSECRPPVRGVIHSAGVARPQLLAQSDRDEFLSAFPPKAIGAWNLHCAFAARPLDFFVLFSSVAALVASMGQGNYAAANTFLDLLAQQRRAQGLPALSVGWGPWGDVGMAMKLDLTTFFHDRGLYPMSADQGCRALGRLLTAPELPHAVVLGAKWTRVGETSPLGIAAPHIQALVEAERAEDAQAGAAAGDAPVDIHLRLAECEDEAALARALAEYVRELACRILRADPAALDLDDSISQLGLDSMMAIEMKNRIEHSLRVGLSVLELLKGATPNQLGALLAAQIQADRVAAQDAAVAEVLAQMSELSEEQLESLLAGGDGE